MLYHESIRACVAERGVFAGRTMTENLARSAVKLQEEIAEVVVAFLPANPDEDTATLANSILHAGNAARDALHCSEWCRMHLHDIAGLKAELADVYVVLACLVTDLERITGESFDLAGAALAKARADIGRRHTCPDKS